MKKKALFKTEGFRNDSFECTGEVSKDVLLSEYINKLFEQEHRWIEVNRIIQTINNTDDISALTKFFCRELQTLTNADFCAVFVLNFETGSFDNSTIFGSRNIKSFKTLFSKKVKELSYLIKNNNISNQKSLEEIRKITINDYIAPIIIQNDFAAIFGLHTQEPLIKNNNINITDIIFGNYKQSLERILLQNKLKSALKHKTEFIAGITHEFKTPMNAVVGFAQLLKSQEFSKEKTQHFLDSIITNSNYILRLVENILDVSKIELKHLNLTYEKVNVKTLIEEVATILGSLCLAKNIRLVLNLTDIEIYLDKMRFKQVIYNLFNNAVKFTPPNGCIKIITYIRDNDFCFEILDTGAGISQEYSKRIFEMFEQGGEDILKKNEGHGLGLYISKEIIKLHGGCIACERNFPKGSIFKFNIPVKNV